MLNSFLLLQNTTVCTVTKVLFMQGARIHIFNIIVLKEKFNTMANGTG